jgi:nucleotide-binding universal stress UspA family protein
MLRSILVPLDGSPLGEHALPLALALARRASSRLQLAHVHQTIPPVTVAGLVVFDQQEARFRQEELAYLNGVVQRLTAVAPVTAEGVLLDGEVARAIQDRAVQTGTDLVVMSTHGRGALSRFWLGSVADELVRRLSLPLLLVRPQEGPIDLTAECRIRHILLPLDGTPLAEQVLETARMLGGLCGARFTLLRVVQPALRPGFLGEGSTPEGLHDSPLQDLRLHQRKSEEEAQAYLDGVALPMRQQGVSVETRVRIEEQPALGILGEAEASKADLIALETHGRRGLSRLILGSVADKVVRGTTLPVLLHRCREA